MLPSFIINSKAAGFEKAIQIFNSAINFIPKYIALCTSAEEVRIALNYARSNGLPISIKSGGHNVAGLALCNEGLVIDLSPMKSIRIFDGVAHVQSGVTLGELDIETQKFGLAVPAGTVTSTGIAGLALGGGVGWLVGKYGLTCDHLIAATVMLADGVVIEVTNENHQDLLWALRGGGGNFGIVLEFKFNLVRTNSIVASSIILPITDASEALTNFGRVTASGIPRSITTSPALLKRSNEESIISIDSVVTADSQDEAFSILDRFSQNLNLGDYSLQGKTYLEAQRMLDPSFSERRRCYWRSAYTQKIDAIFSQKLVNAFNAAPSSRTVILVEHLHGAYHDSSVPTSFSQRQWSYNIALAAQWTDATEDQKNKHWCSETYERLLSHGNGEGYLNYFGVGDTNAVSKAYTAESLKKLREVKRKYDPENLFKANHNISP